MIPTKQIRDDARGKAIDFMVHKDALPKELKKKLGIK